MCLKRLYLFLLLSGLTLWAVPTFADADVGLKYRVRFSGVEDRDLLNRLKSVSDAVELRALRPATEMHLQRRAQRDIPRFLQILHGDGYYKADVRLRVRTDRRVARVRYVVEQGDPYVFRAVRVMGVNGAELDPAPPFPAAVGLELGVPARATLILRAEERIAQAYRRQGYPFAQVTSREVRVFHDDDAVDIDYVVDPGPLADFGEVHIAGLDNVKEPFVRRKIPWQPGDPYRSDHVRLAHRRLTGADLFSTLRILPATELDEEGRLPVEIRVGERKHRSVGIGAGYRSDAGFWGRLSWEHRNLAGAGERLALSTTLSEIGYIGEARFRKPDVIAQDQAFHTTARIAKEDSDAYLSRNWGVVIGMDREHTPGWMVGAGVGFKYSDVEDGDRRDRYGLLYLPLHSDLDRSDDVLDPRRGWRLSISGAPYWDALGNDVTFYKGRIGTTRYGSLSRRFDLDWAGRITLGSMVGASREAIPADDRFYAGGGGTVRGYEYQTAGPLVDGRPVGGKSLLLLSTELRWRVTREFGLVLFLDGGRAFEESYPDEEELKWGTGVGVRYFTPVGPLRFDIATPINRRSGIDKAYQFYISLGQAF